MGPEEVNNPRGPTFWRIAEICESDKIINKFRNRRIPRFMSVDRTTDIGDTYIMMRENTHMEHFEDLLFENSDLLTRVMHGEVEFTRKWDGAPSIFFGIDDLGAWIARKGLFNKDAKKYYKRSDFDDDPKFPEDLKTPLWNTLVYLGNAYAGPEAEDVFMQGDLMFTDGTEQGHFHANTIQYFSFKIPEKARVGIVWHTAYFKGKIKYGARIKEHFKISDELWMINAHDEIEDFTPDFGQVPVVGNYAHLSEKTKLLFKTYQNAVVKGNASSLMDFLFDDMASAVDSVKMEKTKTKKILSYKIVFEELAANPNLERDYVKLQEYKMFLLKQFNDLSTDFVPQLVEARDGNSVSTDHEGYAVFDEHGNAAKIVDREKFSAANFSDKYIKGWSK